MNLYIDESGSINNHDKSNTVFVIAMIKVSDVKSLQKAYKRFVSSNLEELRRLDDAKNRHTGGGKMFRKNRFRELKGSQFDRDMKLKFLDFFSRKKQIELFYIKVDNSRLSDRLCENKSRIFNYVLRMALEHWIKEGYLEDGEINLQLDERNEKITAKHFLENYLNTEFLFGSVTDKSVSVQYFDSSENALIQLADVFSNIFYSNLKTDKYNESIADLRDKGILKNIFEFPS